MMIEDFIRMNDEVAFICRPRRYGKTLNMTMLREFFDITVDNKIFSVIFLTFKDCKAASAHELLELVKQELYREFLRYENKKSIFSQLNNPKVYTVLHKQYDAYFGLTEEETKTLLVEYGLESYDKLFT